jgi:hypothetical protein
LQQVCLHPSAAIIATNAIIASISIFVYQVVDQHGVGECSFEKLVAKRAMVLQSFIISPRPWAGIAAGLNTLLPSPGDTIPGHRGG